MAVIIVVAGPESGRCGVASRVVRDALTESGRRVTTELDSCGGTTLSVDGAAIYREPAPIVIAPEAAEDLLPRYDPEERVVGPLRSMQVLGLMGRAPRDRRDPRLLRHGRARWRRDG